MMLRRITSGGNFIPQVDGLRFVAIFFVVFYHLHGYAFGYDKHLGFALGSRGVQLFFVLSGFILSLPFAKHQLCGGPSVNLKKYFLRRVTRLEPPYILSVLMFFALLHVVRISPAHGSVGLPHLAATLAYAHGLLFGTMSTINPVAWSLEIEIQFYLLMPLLATIYLAGRIPRRVILIVIAVTFAAINLWFGTSSLVNLTILGNVQFFAAGLLLSDFFVVGLPAKSYVWDFALTLWPLILLVPGESFVAAMPLLCFFLYASAFCGKITSRVLSAGLIPTIGGMCYSIYLFHYQISAFFARYIHNVTVFYLVSVMGIMVFCAAFFVVIERPCMMPDWPTRLATVLNFPRRHKETLAAPH